MFFSFNYHFSFTFSFGGIFVLVLTVLYVNVARLMTRDGVLEASNSARGGLEAVFFNWLGLASASHGLASVSTLLPRPRLCLIVSASVLARSGR